MFLLIDKPKGITSHDVIDKVRKITGEKLVGHAGTLDPSATGLLIVGVGRESTKKLGELSVNTKKKYIAEIYLGEERETDDSEGRILRQAQDDKADLKILPALSNSKVEKVIHSFVGEQMQVPPIYSAIKIKGKKAYELARKGEEVKLKPRKITIHSIKLLSYKFPEVVIETDVSKGTYIRALARDIGVKLGCGAYLKNLRRTQIGNYDITQAISLNKLNKDNWKDYVIDY